MRFFFSKSKYRSFLLHSAQNEITSSKDVPVQNYPSLHELGQKELDFVQGKLFELVAEVVLDSDGIRVFEEVRDRNPGVEEFRLEQTQQ